MHKDIALGLACLAAFGLALLYVSRAPEFDRERSAREIARLERRARALEQRLASLSTKPAQEVRSAPLAALPAHRGVGDADEADDDESAGGAAGSGVAIARQAVGTPQDAAQAEVTSQVLGKLLHADLKQGIAAVDEMVASARGPNATRTAMLSMSRLAEVEGPAVESALHEYVRAEPKLLRLHAAKLLDRRGDKAPLASVLTDLTADLGGGDEQRRVQAVALLRLAGDPASTGKILPMLRDDSGAVRRAAILALRRLDDGSLHASLTPLLSDPDPRVREAAQTALRTTR